MSELPTKVTRPKGPRDDPRPFCPADPARRVERAPIRVRVFAELIRAGLQALIDAEATQVLGAGRYERTEERTNYRNGTRSKTVSTTSGDIEVQIPKLRAGSFFPSLLERRRRIDQALHAVIMEAYVHGVSTRNVDDLVAALGVELGGLQVAGLADLRRAG